MLPSSQVKTLADARRAFLRKQSPKLLASVVVLELVARVAIGDWTWRDPAVALALLVTYPFGEWAIHVYLLHGLPNWSTAKAHRSHHEHPHNLDTVLLDPPETALLLGVAVPLVSALLALPLGLPPEAILTGMLTGSVLVMVYEWTHFLIHTAHRPKTRAYRAIWRTHRLHHFKNEHYWHGITTTIADRAFGTFPDQESVPRSPTARLLSGKR